MSDGRGMHGLGLKKLAALSEANRVDVQRLLRQIISEFGGVEGIAREAWRVYKDPSTAAGTKAALLGNIFGLIAKNSEADDDMDDLEKQAFDAMREEADDDDD